MQVVEHTLSPIYDKNSNVLILGTMPSPKSREVGFYYGHPQNRFWKVLADIFNEESLTTTEEKITFLHRHQLALWDVLQSCEIQGADDASIKNPIPNDLTSLLQEANIKAIFTTGKKATDLYMKYCYPKTNIPAIGLPSSSPANRRISYEKLKEEYSKILEYLIEK
ncbi:DNA-deoxyinosine glycosylase [Turicibacter bilis]|uniref:DNA-deoxyinosine glycosylase n=1 Tax=Turicibacter bilis TaxID=2735723 RepID=UPI003F89B9B3